MVDLRAKPFYLDDEAVRWVENTYESMTDHERACQLFFDPLMGMDRQQLKAFLDKYPIGGSSFRGAQFPKEETQDILRELQATQKIPMFIATDTETGANMPIRGGSYIGNSAACGATADPEKHAYHVASAAAREIKAAGYNMSFGAVGDILMNWRNCLVNLRAYGNTAEDAIRGCEGFIRGFREQNMITMLKHYPGDGWEERDQHIVIGNNGLGCDEWDASFGRVYKHFIDEGVLSIMVGHFTLPAWQKKLNPALRDRDVMPACLSPELIDGLLRGVLGFNGLVLTDQTKMLGYYAMPRRDAVVQTIMSGIDVVLGINDMEEDLAAMKAGIADGRITPERLRDAIYRILATKAAIGLHKSQKDGSIVPPPEALKIVGDPEFHRWSEELSDESITLVKNTKDQLPIRPETHKRLFVNFLGSTFTRSQMGQGVTSGGAVGTRDYVKQALEKAGFEVDMFQESGMLGGKGNTAEFREKHDAALIFADFTGFAHINTYRIDWGGPMSMGCPWYEPEIPTAFISLNFTNHMIDVPRVPIFINAYNDKPWTIDLLIKKLMGESPFKGRFNENVWCGLWDTHF